MSERVMPAPKDLSCYKRLDEVNANLCHAGCKHTTDCRYKPDLIVYSKAHGMVKEPEVPRHHLEDAKAQ